MKDLEPSLNQNWEKPNSNWLQGKGGLIEMILGIQDTRIRRNIKISVTGHKKLEVIRSLFLTLGLSLPSSLGVLAWQLSSLSLLHLVRESKLPALGFYIPRHHLVRKEAQSYQSSMMFFEWPTSDHLYRPRSVILAGICGPMTGFTWSLALTQQHTWISVSSRTTWLKLGRGSPKDSDWGMI